MLKSNVLFLTTILFVFLALFTFFHGMFLTTSPLPNVSHINPLDDSTKWFEPKSKVIMLIYDGLRFDYLFDDPTVPTKESYKFEKSHLFQELLVKSPEKVVVCRAFADTPTLTVQRVPSLSTGGLPPKANTLLAFGALPLSEDSIVKQAHLAGRKPYFTGDTLWNEFFPNDLITTTETRGFDIKDENVDDESIAFIHDTIKNKEFNLIIGHLMAVDHMSHAHGIGDERMSQAVKAMDQVIRDVIDIMDDSTTLFVMGDHGTDFHGEHGHGSPGETNTAIIGFHKKGFQKYNQDFSPIMRSINETKAQVRQEDFVPTVSMLLGNPIPFSNLGQIISDMYPVGSYPQLENCKDSSFEIQMLRDNYLNNLQIWKYFVENQREYNVYQPGDVKKTEKFLQEIGSDYNNIQDTLKNPEKCSQVHQMVIDTIQKCQQFSAQVFKLTRNSGTWNVPVTLIGMGSLVLILVCYFIIIQYIYNYVPQEEKMFSNIQDFGLSLKNLIPLGIMLPIISTVTWYLGHKRGIYGFVGAFLGLVFWFIGSTSIFLLKKKEEKGYSPDREQASNVQVISLSTAKEKSSDLSKKDDSNYDDPEEISPSGQAKKKYQDDTPLFNGNNENTPFLPSSSFFLFQNLRYTAILVGIFVLTLYLIHVKNFLVLNVRYAKPASPFIAILLIGYRLGTIFRGKMAIIMVATAILCAAFISQGMDLMDIRLRVALGLLIAADWVWSEVHYIVKGLNTHKAWGYAHLTAFALVCLYNFVSKQEGFYVDILLPKTVYALLFGIIVMRKVIRVEPEVFKRNVQLCIVTLLFLIRLQREIIGLALFMVFLKFLTQRFERANTKNFLYPIAIAMASYVGLFTLEFTDFFIPFNFTVAFIGLSKFNMLLSPLLFLISYLSTFIFGFIQLSHYHQYIDSNAGQFKPMRLHDSESSEDDEKPTFLPVGHAKIIKKRNIILFVIYFNIVMISASIRLFVLRESHFNVILEKYLLDMLFYLVSIGVGYFML